jgi:hypothetical protein
MNEKAAGATRRLFYLFPFRTPIAGRLTARVI